MGGSTTKNTESAEHVREFTTENTESAEHVREFTTENTEGAEHVRGFTTENTEGAETRWRSLRLDSDDPVVESLRSLRDLSVLRGEMPRGAPCAP
jgi:hypothetical protein